MTFAFVHVWKHFITLVTAKVLDLGAEAQGRGTSAEGGRNARNSIELLSANCMFSFILMHHVQFMMPPAAVKITMN